MSRKRTEPQSTFPNFRKYSQMEDNTPVALCVTRRGPDGCNGARRDTGLAATFRIILAFTASMSRLVAREDWE